MAIKKPRQWQGLKGNAEAYSGLWRGDRRGGQPLRGRRVQSNGQRRESHRQAANGQASEHAVPHSL